MDLLCIDDITPLEDNWPFCSDPYGISSVSPVWSSTDDGSDSSTDYFSHWHYDLATQADHVSDPLVPIEPNILGVPRTLPPSFNTGSQSQNGTIRFDTVLPAPVSGRSRKCKRVAIDTTLPDPSTLAATPARHKRNAPASSRTHAEIALQAQSRLGHMWTSMQKYLDDMPMTAQPATLVTRLLGHQRQALYWLLEQAKGHDASGAILADDMGVGKTLQTIAYLCSARPRKTLVLCPTITLGHWQGEFIKHCVPGKVSVYTYHGTGRNCLQSALEAHDIVIACHTTARSEYRKIMSLVGSHTLAQFLHQLADGTAKLGFTSLFATQWDCLVVDEAHVFKSRKSQIFDSCAAMPGKFRVALTGTPMENSIDDLYTLLRFVRHKLYPDYDAFVHHVSGPIARGDLKGHDNLETSIRQCMLRRCKTTHILGKPIITLPPVVSTVEHLVLTPQECAFYNSVADDTRKSFAALTNGGDQRVPNSYGQVLVLILRLRQACVHPHLIYQRSKPASILGSNVFCAIGASLVGPGDSSTTQDVPILLDNTSAQSEHDAAIVCSADYCSTKMAALLAAVQRVPTSEKIVVFSQFPSFLAIVGKHLSAAGHETMQIDGRTPQAERTKVLGRFDADAGARVLLLSLHAAGVGINLTAANHVFLMDLWWNTAVEQQAIDRVYRIGQSRQVHVTRFVAQNTIESRMLLLQQEKGSSISRALNPDEPHCEPGVTNSRLFSYDELTKLFSY